MDRIIERSDERQKGQKSGVKSGKNFPSDGNYFSYCFSPQSQNHLNSPRRQGEH